MEGEVIVMVNPRRRPSMLSMMTKVMRLSVKSMRMIVAELNIFKWPNYSMFQLKTLKLTQKGGDSRKL